MSEFFLVDNTDKRAFLRFRSSMFRLDRNPSQRLVYVTFKCPSWVKLSPQQINHHCLFAEIIHNDLTKSLTNADPCTYATWCWRDPSENERVQIDNWQRLKFKLLGSMKNIKVPSNWKFHVYTDASDNNLFLDPLLWLLRGTLLPCPPEPTTGFHYPFNTSHLKNQHTMSNVTFTIFIRVHFTLNSFLFDFNNRFVICLSSQKLQLLPKSPLLFKCEPNRILYVSIIAPL